VLSNSSTNSSLKHVSSATIREGRAPYLQSLLKGGDGEEGNVWQFFGIPHNELVRELLQLHRLARNIPVEGRREGEGLLAEARGEKGGERERKRARARERERKRARAREQEREREAYFTQVGKSDDMSSPPIISSTTFFISLSLSFSSPIVC
jgi:hypothetical protein